MTLLATDRMVAVVGLGETGLSCARHLLRQGRRFVVMDSRESPPGAQQLRTLDADIPLHCGSFRRDWLEAADEIWLSPGVPRSHAALQGLPEGIRIRGDIDVFAELIDAPLVAITGTNGKSTVTSLLGEMARVSGVNVAVGGNLGTPALDLLDDAVELYVLEVSSFQLETTHRLAATVATILNMSEDHLDRYAGMLAYHQAKLRVYYGCEQAVFNRQDPLSQAPLAGDVPVRSFGLDVPDLGQFGLLFREGQEWLGRGLEPLLPARDLRLQGRHNWANALAALALAEGVGLPMAACLETLRTWSGLPHRCEWVRDHAGVRYINDSKATNVSATVAAIEGLRGQCQGRLWVLLGGQGKGQDFRLLAAVARQNRIQAVVYGQDADAILASLPSAIDTWHCNTLAEAVQLAAGMAAEKDLVLLSPACASFDQFAHYQERGDSFRREVLAL